MYVISWQVPSDAHMRSRGFVPALPPPGMVSGSSTTSEWPSGRLTSAQMRTVTAGAAGALEPRRACAECVLGCVALHDCQPGTRAPAAKRFARYDLAPPPRRFAMNSY